MKKYFLVLAALLVMPALAHAEGKFLVNGTNYGQYADLAITGGSPTTTTKSGLKATIDLGSIAQTSTSATTTPVLKMYQAASTGPVYAFTCTAGTNGTTPNSCPTYTTTAAAKINSIKVTVNGVTGWIDVKGAPN